MAEEGVIVDVEGRRLRLKKLDKILWPDEGYTKADLYEYYTLVGPYMLPHLKDRPVTLHRHPHGIHGEEFYQKDAPPGKPDWVDTWRHHFKDVDRDADLILVNDLASLVWVVSLASIEIHTWLSRATAIKSPDYAVFDLDPAQPAGFKEAFEVAQVIRAAIAEFDLTALPKTSGSKGLQLFVPVGEGYSYKQIRDFVEFIGRAVGKAMPDLVTWEWAVAARSGKVRIDYTQNVFGKTMVAPYSARPVPGAKVSTPVTWDELAAGVTNHDFDIKNVPQRLREVGDLFAPLLLGGQSLAQVLEVIDGNP